MFKRKSNKKTILKKTTACTLALTIAAGSAFTASALSQQTLPTGDTVTRISNPEGIAGQIDGLINDRENGYGWSIAERGDYIYIGGWRNTVGAVVRNYLESALVASGLMDSETVWALTDIVTNNEIPYPTNKNSGVLVKMKKSDPGSFEIVAEMEDPFRNVVNYEDDIYFATYVGVSGNDAKIYKLDKDDKLTEVYSTAQGSSMRANCIYRDYLYFAGTKAEEKLKDGEPVSLAVVRKHGNDDGWDMVADYRDFSYVSEEIDSEGNVVEVQGSYANDPFVSATAGSPFWDMVVFNDEIYATIPNMTGYVVFKGHPAKEGEDANEYGWVWTEVIGRDKNSPNNQGLADNKNGYTDAESYAIGYQSVVGALGVFNGHLYTYDIDHTIAAELMGIRGMLSLLSDPSNTSLEDFLKPLKTTLDHPQTLWRMDNETGKFEEMKGFTELTQGTANEYIWKHGIYNDEFYISTMDSKVIYNYLTRLTNGSLAEMTEEEWKKQISYISSFVESLMKKYSENTEEQDISGIIQKLAQSVQNYNPSDERIKQLEEQFGSELEKLNVLSGKVQGTAEELAASEELQNLAGFIMVWADSRGIFKEEDAEVIAGAVGMIMQLQNLDINDEQAVGEFMQTYGSIPERLLAILERIGNDIMENPEKYALTEEESESFKALFGSFKEKAESVIGKNFQEEIAVMQQISEKVEESLSGAYDMYMEISELVKNDVQGFDIFKSSDGENWELVTDDGFGDKYNYGALRFLTSDEGMYITTANPFYGTQLYLLSNDKNADAKDSVKAESSTADWEKGSSESVIFSTDSKSNWVTVRRDGKLFGADIEDGFTIENGSIKLAPAFLELLDKGENVLTFVLEEGKIDVTVNVSEKDGDNKPSDSDNNNQNDDPAAPVKPDSPDDNNQSDNQTTTNNNQNNNSTNSSSNSQNNNNNNNNNNNSSNSQNTTNTNGGNNSDTANSTDGNSSAPTTGDLTPIGALLAAVSASVMGIFHFAKRKKNTEE